MIYKLFSWAGGSAFYKRNSVEFSAEFRELDYFIEFFKLSGLGSKPFFLLKQVRMPDARCLAGFCLGFEKLRPNQGHAVVATCQPLLSRDMTKLIGKF